MISNTTLTKEFALAHKLFGFYLHDFRTMTITAMKSAFLSYKTRKKMIRKIAEEFEQEFGLMPEYVETGYQRIRSRK
jgi:adenosine deaminase